MSKYAFGYWESLWPSEPFLRVRIALDLSDRTAIAIQERLYGCWFTSSRSALEYLNETISESYAYVSDDPNYFGLVLSSDLPPGRSQPRPPVSAIETA